MARDLLKGEGGSGRDLFADSAPSEGRDLLSDTTDEGGTDFRLPEERPFETEWEKDPTKIADIEADPETGDSWGTTVQKSLSNIPTIAESVYGGLVQRGGEGVEIGLDQGGLEGASTIAQHLIARAPKYAADRKEGETPGETIARVDSDAARRGEEIVRRTSERLKQNQPDVQYGSGKYYVGKAIESSAYTVPALVGSLATRNPAVGAAMIAPAAKGQSYGQARQEGRGAAEAEAKSTFEALTEAGSEYIPLRFLTGEGKRMVSRTLGGAVAEGGQEMANEAMNIGYELGVLDEDMSADEAWRTLRDAGIIGSLMGGGMGVISEGGIQARKKLAGESGGEAGQAAADAETVADPAGEVADPATGEAIVGRPGPSGEAEDTSTLGTDETARPEDITEPTEGKPEPVDIPGMPEEDVVPAPAEARGDDKAGPTDQEIAQDVPDRSSRAGDGSWGTPEEASIEGLESQTEVSGEEQAEQVGAPQEEAAGFPADQAAEPAMEQDAAPSEAQPEIQIPENLQDPRLKRPTYRGALETSKRELQKGGGGAGVLKRDPDTGEVTGRTKSMNPQWAQDVMAKTGLKVADLQNAIDKSLQGAKLGDQQAEAVGMTLDSIQAEREEGVEATRDEIKERRTARPVTMAEVALGPENYREADTEPLFEESEYPADWDGKTRDLFELEELARDVDPEAAQDAMERAESDYDAAKRFGAIIQGAQDGQGGTGQGAREGGAEPGRGEAPAAQDLLGDDTERIEQRNALLEAERERDRQRQGDREVGIDEGEGGADLFSPDTQQELPTEAPADAGASSLRAKGSTVYRVEEGSGVPDTTKPQGLYTAPEGHPFMEELEGEATEYRTNADNPLDVSGLLQVEGREGPIPGDRSVMPASSGIKAFRKMVGEEEANRMAKTRREDLQPELEQHYPEVDWGRFTDKYEMLEAVGGIEARRAGYDAIVDSKVGDGPLGSEEFVALEDSALEPVESKVRSAEQEAQTSPYPAASPESEAFQEWFGDSKVVNEDGSPKVVYHGTARGDFDVFDTFASNYGLMGMGGYFTEDPSVASEYTQKGAEAIQKQGGEPAATVYPAYLATQNPIDMEASADTGEWYAAYSPMVEELDRSDFADVQTNEDAYRVVEEALRREEIPLGEGADIMQDGLRNMGHDGLTHMGGGRVNADGPEHRVWVAFEPEQVKSASGNRGTFDPSDPRINYAQGTTSLDTGRGQGITTEVARKAIADTRLNWGTNAPEVAVVQSVTDLPGPIQAEAEQGGGAVQGASRGGTIYLVADNLASQSAAKRVLAHEAVGHFGMETMLGEDFQDMVGRVQRLKEADNRRVMEVAEEVRQRYGDLDAQTESHEILAVMAEKGVKHPVLKRATAKIKDWLRKAGFNVPWSQTELESLLAKAGRYLRGDGAQRRQQPRRDRTTFAFAGQRAETADTYALDRARKRLEEGADPEQVRQETGWFQGPDGEWRFEISDELARLKVLPFEPSAREIYDNYGEFIKAGDFLEKYPGHPMSEQIRKTRQMRERVRYTGQSRAEAMRGRLKLEEVLHHPQLFSAYPSLRSVSVRVDDSVPIGGASYEAKGRTILLGPTNSEERAKTALLHEIQHALQNEEGFAVGGSPSQGQISQSQWDTAVHEMEEQFGHLPAVQEKMRRLRDGEITREQYEEEIVEVAEITQPFGVEGYMHDLYERLAGEVEARNTQARQGMTAAERQATPPEQTADRPAEDVIVQWGGEVMENAPRPENAPERTRFARDTTNPETVAAGKPGSPIKKFAGERLKPIQGWARKYFTVSGNVPEGIWDEKIKQDGWIRSHEKVGEDLVNDLQRGVKKAYGKPSQEQIRELDAALKGQVAIDNLPEQVQLPIKRMRAHIDALSQKLVREGVVSGDLAAKVTENLGVYATRSYRVFDDPKWADKVSPEVREKAKAFIRDQYTDIVAREWAEQQAREGVLESDLMKQDGEPFQAKQFAQAVLNKKGMTDDYVPVPDGEGGYVLRKVDLEAIKRDMATPGTEANTYREDRVEGKINQLLFEGKAGESPMSILAGGKLGAKDLSVLKKRKDIAPEIRALWGEYEGPMQNYARSIDNMVQLISNHRLQQDMRDQGMGQFFFDRPQGEYSVRVASSEQDTLWPMTQWGDDRVDIYTSPEIKEALETALSGEEVPGWLANYMKANAVVKYNATVGSVMTHVRNTVGNTPFAVAQGHWRANNAWRAAQTVWADVTRGGPDAVRRYQEKMLRLGVIHESVRAGEMQDVLEEATRSSLSEFQGNRFQRAAKKGLNTLTNIYQAEDDVWKIYAFENEKARYEKAFPDETEAQIEERAAKTVRMTYPTYSLVPEAVKKLRRFPVTGTFVSFPAEVIRVTGNTVSLISSEIRSDNAELRKIGAQRLVGSLIAGSLPTLAAMTSMYALGLSSEDDEDFRKFVPPWSENSDILYTGYDDKGRLQWIDLSYTDPYEYVKTPIRAFMRGEDWTQSVVEMGTQALEPFLGLEILFGKGVDVLRNQTETGSKVYNPQDSYPEIGMKVTGHILEAANPGTISSLERVYKGMTGEVEPYGKSYDPGTEAAAMLTGFRLNTLDVPQALSFKASEYGRSKRNVARMMTGPLSNRGEVTDDEIRGAFQETIQTHRDIFREMHGSVRAAIALGMTQEEVLKVLDNNGVSKREAMNLVQGRFIPYRPSSSFLQSAAEGAISAKTSQAEKQRLQQRYRERAQRLKDLYQGTEPEVVD